MDLPGSLMIITQVSRADDTLAHRSETPAPIAMGIRQFTLGLALGGMMLPVFAQAQEETVADEHARHEVSLLLAHTHVAQGVNAEGDLTWLALPSWGLNYNFWFSPKWAIGLHTDFINETFKVEENLSGEEEKPTVERTRPIAPALILTYRPHHHWAFALGGGQEFAEEGNLPLVRAGLEYTIHLVGHWETSGSFAYDFRFDAFDSYTLGIGISRVFR